MFYLPALTVQRLRDRGVVLDPGLTDDEVARVQERVGFTFGPEHRELLQDALPVGESWPDWRHGSTEELRNMLDWPIEGILGHVLGRSFWPASWGGRPGGHGTLERVARGHLARVPGLVPIYKRRYIAADPAFVPSPVFSIHETDVIIFGNDLLDYVAREFHVPPRHQSRDCTFVPFWSDISEGLTEHQM